MTNLDAHADILDAIGDGLARALAAAATLVWTTAATAGERLTT